MANSMKAWQYTNTTDGLEKNLRLNDTATPPSKHTLSKDQILVEVISASINPADHKIPELGMVSKLIISTPASPGMDFCGRVIATHTTNDVMKEGQKVFGKLDGPTQFGTCGQYVVANTEGCVALPEGVDEDQAAAIGTAGLTAYQSIKPFITTGSKVFINGGSGGTGTFGIQIAKLLGAEVTTTCSTANIELCKELGADVVIDYKKEDLLQVLQSKGQIFDLVVDNVGTPAELYKECHSFLKPGCNFVQVGAAASIASATSLFGRMLQPSWLGGGQRPFRFLQAKNKQDDFVQIGKWVAEGKVKAVIDQVFEWDDAPKAFEKLKTQRAKGKIVVHVTAK
jgi:NADPH:quinone reductase-like Zn-dependent oxidoreductase